MADVDLKIDYLSLGVRPRQILMDSLCLAENYRLARISKKWQAELKAREYVFDQIEFDVENEHEYYALILGNGRMKLSVYDELLEDIYLDTFFVVEHARDYTSQASRMHQFSIATSLIMDMFLFSSIELRLRPDRELEERIRQLSEFDFNIAQDTVNINIQFDALTRRQLRCIMTTFVGRELRIGDVRVGHAERLPLNFEVLCLTGTNWLTEDMLMRMEGVKEIYIRRDDGDGVNLEQATGRHLLYEWLRGGFPDLKCFQYNVFVEDSSRAIVKGLLYRIGRFRHPPYGTPEDIIETDRGNARFFRRPSDGKWGVLFVREFTEEVRKEIVFKAYFLDEQYNPWHRWAFDF